MTDKKIIIDGVDVSKCEYLQYKGCNFPQCLVKIASFDLKCEGYNCHLKRLVQKEQECETSKDENFTFEELIKIQEELIDKYRQALRSIEDIIMSVKSDPSYYPKEQKIYMWCQKVLDIIDKKLEV